MAELDKSSYAMDIGNGYIVLCFPRKQRQGMCASSHAQRSNQPRDTTEGPEMRSALMRQRERGSAIPTILGSVSDQVEPSRRVAPRHFRGCGVPKLDFPKSHNEDFGAGGGSLLQPCGSGRATASLTPAAPPIGSSGAKATLWRQWRSRSGHRPVVSMGRISELVLLQKRL